MRHSLLAVLAFCSILIQIPIGRADGQEDFTGFLRDAESSTMRDEKVEYLMKALKSRPGNPENIVVEFEIASLLHNTTSPGQPPKPLEAFEYYERILTAYEYEDYYVVHYDEGANWKELKQSLLVQSAIQAGCICNFVLKNHGRAREYQHKAMEMLADTFERRKDDWLKEAKPNVSPIADLDEAFGRESEKARKAYEYQISQWNIRQEKAKEGDVLERGELNNAKIAVKHFGLSYGPQSPVMVPLAMRQIIKDFPGTPMADIAQEHIDRSAEISMDNISKTMGFGDLQIAPEEKNNPMPLPDERTTRTVEKPVLSNETNSTDELNNEKQGTSLYWFSIPIILILGMLYMKYNRRKKL